MGNNPNASDSLERNTSAQNKDVKVILVGPPKSGKTALIQRFVNNIFCDTYVPTGFEKYTTRHKLDELTIQFSIWDTSGSAAYDSVRPLAYQDANVFLLCFNIGDPESLNQTINKWYPEIRSHCQTTPIILCGCRSDSKEEKYLSYTFQSTITTPVAHDLIRNTCKKISAVAYVETTALYSDLGVQEAFEVAAKASLGILNNKVVIKKQKKTPQNNSIGISKNNNKSNIKQELKGRAKNCCVM